jgi:hypothetical protein
MCWFNDGAAFRDAFRTAVFDIYNGQLTAWSTAKYTFDCFSINWGTTLLAVSVLQLTRVANMGLSLEPRFDAERLGLAAIQASLPPGVVMPTDFVSSAPGWEERYRMMKQTARGEWFEHQAYLNTLINICAVFRARVPLSPYVNTAVQLLRVAAATFPTRAKSDSETAWRAKQTSRILDLFQNAMDCSGPATLHALSSGTQKEVRRCLPSASEPSFFADLTIASFPDVQNQGFSLRCLKSVCAAMSGVSQLVGSVFSLQASVQQLTRHVLGSCPTFGSPSFVAC